MHTSLTCPGLIVMDAVFAVLAYNGEALKILTYPDRPEKISHVESWLTNKICTDLARRSPPRFVEEFRSARRIYLCRSFFSRAESAQRERFAFERSTSDRHARKKMQ